MASLFVGLSYSTYVASYVHLNKTCLVMVYSTRCARIASYYSSNVDAKSITNKALFTTL